MVFRTIRHKRSDLAAAIDGLCHDAVRTGHDALDEALWAEQLAWEDHDRKDTLKTRLKLAFHTFTRATVQIGAKAADRLASVMERAVLPIIDPDF